MLKTTLLALFLLPAYAALADIAVLVHGYQSSGQTWRQHGVLSTMQAGNWPDGGHFIYGPSGVSGPIKRLKTNHATYTVDLPSDAPILYQANILSSYLQTIRSFAPQESIILIGHSAGGLVARATMVTHPEHRISRLITIASPHLGTTVAKIARIASQSPAGGLADFLGFDSLPRSRQLFSELEPEKYGNFLFWLNRQPHPYAEYLSIVRVDSRLKGGDAVISSVSQDMRRVVALGRYANSFATPGSHSINRGDGTLLARLLNREI